MTPERPKKSQFVILLIILKALSDILAGETKSNLIRATSKLFENYIYSKLFYFRLMS